MLEKEGPKKGGDRKSKSHDATLNLPDLGITRSQSSRWQSEATVPEETCCGLVANGARPQLTL